MPNSTMSLINLNHFDNSSRRMIKKSNQLIRSRYDLSLTEQRILMIAISFIDNSGNRTVEIPISVYKQFMGLEYLNYKHIVDVLGKLRSNTIIMATEDKKTGEIQEALIDGWVELIHYREGVMNITFTKSIFSHLFDLKEKYTVLELSDMLNLNSKYATRLYEILKSYEFIGHYTIKVDELRELLFLGTKYSRYPDLDRKLIRPCIDEINLINDDDVIIDYIPVRKGTRYDAIEFIIKQKEKIDSGIPPEVAMARSMSHMELFFSIKTLIAAKHNCIIPSNDPDWKDCEMYTYKALESTYVALLKDEWKDYNITSPKAFFAEHLRRKSEELG